MLDSAVSKPLQTISKGEPCIVPLLPSDLEDENLLLFSFALDSTQKWMTFIFTHPFTMMFSNFPPSSPLQLVLASQPQGTRGFRLIFLPMKI
jgi:hypothetical protein